MSNKIERLFAAQADLYKFRSDSDKEKVVMEVEKRFHAAGEVVVNRVNGLAVSQEDFERIVYGVAKPMLKTQTFGRIIPRYIDNRSAADKQRHKDEMGAVIETYLQKLGYVYRGEHLDDQTNRNAVKNIIAEHFVYEGSGEDGEIIFRKFTNGFFSGKTFTPEEVIAHVSGSFLDYKRTQSQQNEIRLTSENEVLKKRGYNSMKQVPKEARDLINDEVAQMMKPVAFSKRRIQFDDSEYESELEKIASFNLGISNPASATLDQKTRINEFKKTRLEELNSLPRVDVKPITTFETPVKIPFENTKGIALTADQV